MKAVAVMELWMMVIGQPNDRSSHCNHLNSKNRQKKDSILRHT